MSKVSAIIIREHGVPVESAHCEEIELPPLGPRAARVRMIASPINPADLNVIEGKYPVRPSLPGVPGNEGAARVVEVGAEVRGLAPGQLVLLSLGAGAWQEEAIFPVEDLLPVPEGIAPEQAAMLRVNPLTALCLLRDFVALQPGEWVLQNAGNSGVGQAVTQIAKALGWRTINVVRRAEVRERIAAETGEVCLLDDEDLLPAIVQATGGAPIRLALNAVGGESALRQANALAAGGTHVTYGAMARQPLKIPNGLLIFKDLRWRGFWVSHWLRQASAEERTARFAELFALAQRGVVRAQIARMYPLAAVAEALEAAGRSGREGKILFGFDAELLRTYGA